MDEFKLREQVIALKRSNVMLQRAIIAMQEGQIKAEAETLEKDRAEQERAENMRAGDPYGKWVPDNERRFQSPAPVTALANRQG